jgi:hypothetical protein
VSETNARCKQPGKESVVVWFLAHGFQRHTSTYAGLVPPKGLIRAWDYYSLMPREFLLSSCPNVYLEGATKANSLSKKLSIRRGQ